MALDMGQRPQGRYARFASAFKRGFGALDQPGPDIGASPFRPGEVTPEAGILKTLTALAGARRSQANFNLAQQYKQQSMYKSALETRLLEDKVNTAGEMTPYQQAEIEIRQHPPARASASAQPFKPAATAIEQYGLHDYLSPDGTIDPHTYQSAVSAAHDISKVRRQKDATAAKAQVPAARLALQQMGQERDRWVDQQLSTPRLAPGGTRSMSHKDTVALAVRNALSGPDAATRNDAAKWLGIRQTMQTDANNVAHPITDENGLPVYDAKEVSARGAAMLATRKASLATQWESLNGDRLAKQKAVIDKWASFSMPGEDAAGDAAPSDPLMDAAKNIFGGGNENE